MPYDFRQLCIDVGKHEFPGLRNDNSLLDNLSILYGIEIGDHRMLALKIMRQMIHSIEPDQSHTINRF